MLNPDDVYQEPGPRVGRALGLASELKRRGEEVKLVYMLKPGTVSIEAARYRQEHPFETLPSLRQATTYLNKAREVAGMAEWADIVWISSALPRVATLGLLAAYLAGRPIHCDLDEWDSALGGEAMLRRATRWPLLASEKWLPKLVDSVSVCSSELKNLVLSRGAPPDRVVHAPSGVNLDQFCPGIDGSAVRRELGLRGKVICFMGKPEHTGTFLRSVLAMDDNIHDLTALVPGEPGSLRPMLDRFCEDRRAVFSGPVERFGLPKLLAAANVCVALYADTPADRARYPIEVVQAMAMGRPVVATAVGEVPGVLGGTGYQPLPNDFMGHVKAMEGGVSDAAHARELATKARAAAEQRCHWGGGAGAIQDMLQLVYDDWKVRHFRPRPPRPTVDGRPGKPPELTNDTMSKVSRLVKSNLDLVGVLDGRVSYTGPRTVQLDVTNACNNDCLACWSFSPLLADKAMPREERGKHLPYDRVMALLDELAGLGTREIYLAGGGDPWMYPRFVDVLERIKKHGMAVTIHTNFSNVDEERARRIVELGVDNLTVSLWAASAPTYAKLHPNKAEETFERVVGTLRFLCALRGERRVPFVKLYNVINKLNAHEFLAMHDFAREVGADAVEFAPVDTIPERTECLLLGEAERATLQEQCEEMRRRNAGGRPMLFDFETFVKRIGNKGSVEGLHDEANVSVMPCTIGFHFARVMADGNVTPCLKGDKIPLGNILQKTFREIWSGERHVWFREKARLIPRSDPFFSLIGKDPAARVGCYKSCDDVGRNRFFNERMQGLSRSERAVLRAAGPVLKILGRAV
jgi:MoaA/NifB/PqqE/SkfB family radical SAM enzyme/glycosyltransferase involved in cell wall biosynthesis